jgi:hypothetical protein
MEIYYFSETLEPITSQKDSDLHIQNRENLRLTWPRSSAEAGHPIHVMFVQTGSSTAGIISSEMKFRIIAWEEKWMSRDRTVLIKGYRFIILHLSRNQKRTKKVDAVYKYVFFSTETESDETKIMQ